MIPACARAARLSLAAVAGQATAAERLELESHLAGCARCSAEHGALGIVRHLRNAEPEELGAAARERIRRTLLARAPSATPAPRRWRWPLGSAVAAAGIAAAAALWLAVRAPGEVQRIAGDVEAVRLGRASTQTGAGRASTPTEAEDAWLLRSARSGEVKLEEARAALAPSTEAVWHGQRRSVELRSGSVTIDVEHRPGQHFEVRTPRFVVEVIGTRFSVDLGSVHTERGIVRVRALDGTLLAYVEAGKSWDLPAPPSAPDLPAPPPAPAAPARAPEPSEAPPPAERAPAPAKAPEMSAAGRLATARRALSQGDAAEARRVVEPAFKLGRPIAAEARALFAESFLVEGRYADAMDGYAILIRDFPTTPQAESALYAVAQLESEHGRPADARAAFARYLDRYPHGRFAKEANDRLARLPAPR